MSKWQQFVRWWGLPVTNRQRLWAMLFILIAYPLAYWLGYHWGSPR